MNGDEASADEDEVTDEKDEDEITVEEYEASFRKVMAWATELACARGWQEAIMEALFAVIVNVDDDIGESLGL